MRCSSLYPIRWPARRLPNDRLSTPTADTNLQRRLTGSTRESGFARECRHRNAPAAVMQVRPLSVAPGIAGRSPFGRPPFGGSRWL